MSDGTKSCVKCGMDVSDKPRTKDKKGNYWCAECAKRAQAARKAKASPKPDEGGDLMDELLKDTVAVSGKSCPECSAPLTNEAILCTHCGYNFETERSMRTSVQEVSKSKRFGRKKG